MYYHKTNADDHKSDHIL